jgi:hypothetical protein
MGAMSESNQHTTVLDGEPEWLSVDGAARELAVGLIETGAAALKSPVAA